MYEQNTSMVAANEQNKFLLPAMVEGDFALLPRDNDLKSVMTFSAIGANECVWGSQK